MSTTVEIVTLDNLRSVSRSRARAYGFAAIIFGILEILWMGSTASNLNTTIEFGSNTSTAMPDLSSTSRVIALVTGLAVAAGVLAAPRFVPGARAIPQILRRIALVVGIVVAAWPLTLWAHVNVGGVLRTWTVPTHLVGIVVGVLSILVGALLAWKRYDRGASATLYGSLIVFLLAFLVWVARGSDVSGLHLQLTSLLAISVSAATCLMFGSLSGTICERSGVVNIAIEGQFMVGAMSSVMFASAFNGTGISKTVAVLLGGVFGALMGSLLAVMALRYKADQVIVGVVIVAFCSAITQFLSSQVLNFHQNLNQSEPLPVAAIPGLSKIPVVGPVLFDQNILVYVAVAIVAATNVLLYRTRWGLRVRSVGEKPIASETVGVSVSRIRYGAVILGGFIAGIGGAAFTVGPGSSFSYGMTSGYGYIALAIMIFGRWRPYGALAASLLFGFTIAMSANLNIYLNQLVIPQQFISALPYIITIAAVAGLVGRVRPPAASGIPFSRE
jgi:simple sugar transport system permease protein